MPAAANTASNAVVNMASRSRDGEPEPMGVLVEVNQRVTGWSPTTAARSRRRVRGWREQVIEADAAVEVPADQVANTVDGLGSVVGGVDVDPERALALGGADDADDRGGDLGRVCAGRGQGGESAADLVYQVGVELVASLGDLGVGGVLGVGEVVTTWAAIVVGVESWSPYGGSVGG
jgi:hypothetical protein